MLYLIITFLVQIVSESFPISSSGHMNVWICIMQYFKTPDYAYITSICANETIIHLLHIPTLLIVIVFFKSYWIKIFQRWHALLPIVIRCGMYTIAADSITMIAYIVYKKYPVSKALTSEHFSSTQLSSVPLWLGFTITALALYSLKYTHSHTTKPKLPHMLLLGLIQSIALLPGVSRFGTVFVAARWLGIRTEKAFAITWMLQFPLMIGAVGLSSIKMYQNNMYLPIESVSMFWIAMIGATQFGFLGLWISYKLASAHKLWTLSFYMLIPITLSLFLCY